MPETPKYDVSRSKIDYILYYLLIQRLKSWWGDSCAMSEVQSVESRFRDQVDHNGRADRVPEPYLSVAEAARALHISPTTLRRYIQDYGTHIDFVRAGRTVSVAVSSIPALAQIRDLRARKLQQAEIKTILTSMPGEVALAGLAVPVPQGKVRDDANVATALKDLRADVNRMKRDSRDSEVVVRQSLANMLFLIEKCSKEIQFHVSEERIASRERDLHLSQYEQEIQLLADQSNRTGGWRAAIASLYRRLGAAFVR